MIGDLKQRITLQALSRSADGGGGFTGGWQNITLNPEVSASIVPLSGSEQLRFHQLETTVTHRIIVRYRTDITAAMRIMWQDKIYHIISVTDKGGLGTYLEILAVLKTPT